MESQLQRPTHEHHHLEEDPHKSARLHSVIGGEGEVEHNHQGEKKSVLKKVKDKAKKIKDTLKKHGGHGHEHDYRHDQVSEEEDDDDEEAVYAPEVHAHESTFISGTNLPKQTGLDLENPPGPPLDGYNPSARSELVYPDVGYGRGSTEISGPRDHGYIPNERKEVPPGQPEDMFKTSTGGVGVTNAPEDMFNRNVRNEMNPDIGGDGPVTRISGIGKWENELGSSAPESELNPSGPDAAMDLEEPTPRFGEDPHAPKNRPGEISPSKYQTKVVDPTGQGGKEADVAPLIERLDNLHVRDETESKSGSEHKDYTGSHGQFAPSTGVPLSAESNPVHSSELPKSFDPAKPESMPQATITGKISSATSAMAGRAVSAKNAVASKLGYGEQQQESHDPSIKSVSETVIEYGHKVAEKVAPVYEKVAGAGSAMMSKVQRGGGTEDETGKGESDKGVSVKEYLAEKFSPGEEDKALSEAITDAFHKRKEGIGDEQAMVQGRKTVVHSVIEKESERDAALTGGSKESGPGVVSRVRGAVSSWLGMGGETQTAQHLHEHGSGDGAERGGS